MDMYLGRSLKRRDARRDEGYSRRPVTLWEFELAGCMQGGALMQRLSQASQQVARAALSQSHLNTLCFQTATS